MSWSTLQLAAAPAGPAFIPALVAILRVLVACDGVRFGLWDERTGTTSLRFAEPSGWTLWQRRPAVQRRASGDRHRDLEMVLPSAPGHARRLRIWRESAAFQPREQLLLECFRQHVMAAWRRQRISSDALIEYAWSSVPMLHVSVDRLGNVQKHAEQGDTAHLLASWQAVPLRELGEGLKVSDDGVMSLATVCPSSRVPRTIFGWLLPLPEGGVTDAFFWEDAPKTANEKDPATVSREAFPLAGENEIDRVGRAWGLTVKQRRVVAELLVGKGNKDIADALGCAEVTVEYHLSTIRRKVGAGGRAALISRFWIDARRLAG